MAEAKTRNLGKVVSVENGVAVTDKKHKSICKCKVGDVLVQDERTRKVSILEPKTKEPTAAQLKKELEALQLKAAEIGIEDVEGKSADELKALIAGKE